MLQVVTVDLIYNFMHESKLLVYVYSYMLGLESVCSAGMVSKQYLL